MSFTFRPAKRESTNVIIILAGPSGSGKTMSAMRIAKGVCGEKPFGFIDTENGRARHYANHFTFDHCDFQPPFSPARYLEALKAVDERGYGAWIIDSFSHEHAGEGGILDMFDAAFTACGHDERKKVLCWQKPKSEHKDLLYGGIIRSKTPVTILCLRAEQKIEMRKDPQTGRLEIVPKQTLSGFHDWIPICEKTLTFEATIAHLVLPDRPGVPAVPHIKPQREISEMFPDGKQIDEEVGRKISAWARGETVSRTESPKSAPAETSPAPAPANARDFQGMVKTLEIRERKGGGKPFAKFVLEEMGGAFRNAVAYRTNDINVLKEHYECASGRLKAIKFKATDATGQTGPYWIVCEHTVEIIS